MPKFAHLKSEGMRLLREYDIDISILKEGRHNFSFQIDKKFFELFDYGLLNDGKLVAEVELDRKSSFIELIFNIQGTIKLVCDRSLDLFDYPLETKKSIIIKFGDADMEGDDEIEYIDKSTININVAKYVYDFIGIAIPMKKLHPRFTNTDQQQEDQIIFRFGDEENASAVDPRWNELKKLKNKSID